MMFAVEGPRLVSRSPIASCARAACLARLAALFAIVVVPTAFWTAVAALISGAVGMPASGPALAAVALVVGALCLVAASAVLSSNRQ